ncbi:MAG TPA: lysophospholipid acyltransferase family protein [Ktedonobacteraceae bacterium]
MTQDVGSTTTSGGHDDAEQQPQVQPQKPAGSEKPAKTKKPEKNLYEPYDTPTILWNTIRIVARVLFLLILKVRVLGRKNLPAKGPFIIASNHLSWTDVPLIPAYLPYKVVSMAKEEAFHSNVGWLVRFMGAFPVKRGEGDRQSIRAADEQLKKGKVFFIFPEGTRSKSHTMAKGHAGLGMIALRSGVPVVPVAIWGSEHALKKFRPRITISFGPPITLKPRGAKITREDIDESTEQVMRTIASMLPPEYRGVYGEQESPNEGDDKSSSLL